MCILSLQFVMIIQSSQYCINTVTVNRNEYDLIILPRKLECTLQIELILFDRFFRRYFIHSVSDFFREIYNLETANWRVREV